MTLLLDDHEDDDWKDLPANIQELCKAIGYTQSMWDADKDPPSFNLEWEQLSQDQKDAAVALGYTEKSWNEED